LFELPVYVHLHPISDSLSQGLRLEQKKTRKGVECFIKSCKGCDLHFTSSGSTIVVIFIPLSVIPKNFSFSHHRTSMAFTKTMVPLRARESFFRDEFFSDCWEIMERQKKEFEQKCADSLSSKETFGNNKLLGSLDSRQGNSGDEFQYSPVTRRYNQPRYHPASLMMID